MSTLTQREFFEYLDLQHNKTMYVKGWGNNKECVIMLADRRGVRGGDKCGWLLAVRRQTKRSRDIMTIMAEAIQKYSRWLEKWREVDRCVEVLRATAAPETHNITFPERGTQ